MPYPFESKRPPTWVRSQFLSITYSMEVDSIRNAQLPFPFTTRSTPSTLLVVNTVGFAESIKDHIRWYVEKLESQITPGISWSSTRAIKRWNVGRNWLIFKEAYYTRQRPPVVSPEIMRNPYRDDRYVITRAIFVSVGFNIFLSIFSLKD